MKLYKRTHPILAKTCHLQLQSFVMILGKNNGYVIAFTLSNSPQALSVSHWLIGYTDSLYPTHHIDI